LRVLFHIDCQRNSLTFFHPPTPRPAPPRSPLWSKTRSSWMLRAPSGKCLMDLNQSSCHVVSTVEKVGDVGMAQSCQISQIMMLGLLIWLSRANITLLMILQISFFFLVLLMEIFFHIFHIYLIFPLTFINQLLCYTQICWILMINTYNTVRILVIYYWTPWSHIYSEKKKTDINWFSQNIWKFTV
jgi:hypothetical protein